MAQGWGSPVLDPATSAEVFRRGNERNKLVNDADLDPLARHLLGKPALAPDGNLDAAKVALASAEKSLASEKKKRRKADKADDSQNNDAELEQRKDRRVPKN